MKRHIALIPFSREHHIALSLGNRILKAPEGHYDDEIRQQRVALLNHFDQEEAQFAAYWVRLNRPDLQEQFEKEHVQLRALLQEPFQAALLAECLIAHVRFEERVLFEELGKMLLANNG